MTSPPLYLGVGEPVNPGPDIKGHTLGWCIVEMSKTGRIGLSAMLRGDAHATYVDVAPEILLRHNPKLLVGQHVRHPNLVAAPCLAEWIVDSVDHANSSLVLARGAERSSAAIAEVVATNIDELQSRMQIVRDPYD